jgi:hypothetical protein
MSMPAVTYFEQAMTAWDVLGRVHLAELKRQFPDVPEKVLAENLTIELGTADLVFLAGVSPEEFEAWVKACRRVDAHDIPAPPRALASFLDANGFGVSSKSRS